MRKILFSESHGRSRLALGLDQRSSPRASLLQPCDSSKEHTRATMTCFGLYCAFRGLREHTYLQKGNMVRGTYDNGPFLGQDYWAVIGVERKTNKLTSTNPVLEDQCPMRIPVDSVPGQIIEKYWGLCPSRKKTRTKNQLPRRMGQMG